MGDLSEAQEQQANQKRGYVIKPCTCKHKWQDATYGHGNRVWNYGKAHRTCTVCGAVVTER